MNECIGDFFIYNGELKPCNQFDKVYPNSTKLLYEVIRIIEKKPLFLNEHLIRLKSSIEISNKKANFDESRLTYWIKNFIEENKIINGNIKIIVDENTSLIYRVKHSYPTDEMYNNGVKTIFYHGERENPNAKVINNSFREKINEKLKETEAYEAILVDHQGNITEGSKSNIFMVKEKIIYTAPLKSVLPGITREKIILACNRLSLEVIEKSIKYNEIKDFDGLFISGTSPKVLPINEIDGFKIHSEKNEIIRGIIRKFNEIINEDLALHHKI